MSDYTKITDFAIKDTLSTGDPDKRVRGSEIDAEFEAIETAVATKANLASPSFTGTPLGPTAALDTNTTQIATTAFVRTQINHELTDVFNWAPVGAVIMWYGLLANIPTGWQACDGTNGTPDLRNRFPVGAGDTYALNASGGSANATLVTHEHTYSGNTGGMNANSVHAHTLSGGALVSASANGIEGAVQNFGGNGIINNTENANTDHGHAYSGTTSTVGSSATNANLPPYRALYFIMKIS